MSSVTENPLLPFQLVKQLEEQSKLGMEDENVKEAAERSIIKSHAKAIQRSMASDQASIHDHLSIVAEKENRTSLGSCQRYGASTPLSILSPSPRTNSNPNNTPLSSAKPQHRPDADGINARKKDVREVLGLPPAPEFGGERASSFLSRITQETYRQDLALPDP